MRMAPAAMPPAETRLLNQFALLRRRLAATDRGVTGAAIEGVPSKIAPITKNAAGILATDMTAPSLQSANVQLQSTWLMANCCTVMTVLGQ